MEEIRINETTSLEEKLAKAKAVIEEYNRLRYEEQARFKGVTWKDHPKKKKTTRPSKQKWRKESNSISFIIKGRTELPDTRCIGTGFCSVLEDKELFAEDLDWYEDPEYVIHDGHRSDDDFIQNSTDEIVEIAVTIWKRL